MIQVIPMIQVKTLLQSYEVFVDGRNQFSALSGAKIKLIEADLQIHSLASSGSMMFGPK